MGKEQGLPGFVPEHFGRELDKKEAKPYEAWKAHEGGDMDSPEQEEKRQLHAKWVEERDRALAEVKDFPADERIKAVQRFEGLVREVGVARKAFRTAKTDKEKEQWARIFTDGKKELDFFFDTPKENAQFEKAYRERINGKAEHRKFLQTEARLQEVEAELLKPAFGGSMDVFAEKEVARLERISQRGHIAAERGASDDISALQFLYTEEELAGEESRNQYEALTEKILEAPSELPNTKAGLEEEKTRLERELAKLWNDQSVRNVEAWQSVDKLLADLGTGKDVLEMPSVIRNLNQLAEWEKLHQRTTIGGVLVGEPGTGKTTLVRHYLESRGRGYVYLDFSEEVTRYTIFGTKALDFKSSTEYYSELAREIGGMDDTKLAEFIRTQGAELAKTYHLGGDEGRAAFFQMLTEELGKAESVDPERLKDAKGKLEGTVGQAYHKELAKKFKHLVQKNGWRDGVVIAALRRGDSVICDEFVKMRDTTLLFGLMTAKPGEKWYFADNDERIDVPNDWRMYFTANIGRKHGGYKVPEALASRAQGKVMEIGYPPSAEEMSAGLATLCDAEGYFLRSKEDIARTAILIKDVFPKIRALLKGKDATIPISWRTIRDIGEKLIEDTQVGNKKIRRPSHKTFDQALYEVLAESYALYEDRTMPREIVNVCTSLGLMLDDDLKSKITETNGYLTEEEFDKRRTMRDEKHVQSWDEIVKELKGERNAMMEVFLGGTRPERKFAVVK